MFWSPFRHHPEDHAAACRAVHERWLTRALASRVHFPRIPMRPAAAGGFDRLLARPGGRDLADRWWAAALERVDLDF